MEQGALNVLLIGESEHVWWHLVQSLGLMGCRLWFASTNEEVRALLEQRPFRFILSAYPVTGRSPILRLVRPGCSVFYSVPVEYGCLWFQAAAEPVSDPRVSALRPKQFMSILNHLVADLTSKQLAAAI
jgi:hypothetical protein